jgi:hypothetical protein
VLAIVGIVLLAMDEAVGLWLIVFGGPVFFAGLCHLLWMYSDMRNEEKTRNAQQITEVVA